MLTPRHLLLCLPADGRATARVEHAAHLAAALDIGWSVAALDGAANEADGAERRAALHRADAAGADVTQAATPAGVAALAAQARALAADIVVTGPPGQALRAALPAATVHVIGTADAPTLARLRGWLRDVPAALCVLALCTLIGLALKPSFESANLIMIYLAGVVYVALKMGRATALLTVLASVLLYDLLFIASGRRAGTGEPPVALVSTVMLLVGLLISKLASQLREQVATADARAARAQALNQLALALAQARTFATIAHALALAVHGTLGASAQLLPLGPDGELGADDGRFPRQRALAAAALRGADATDATLRCRVLSAAGTALGVLAVDHLGRHHDGPEDRALLESFANQVAVALERALFEQRSASAAIEAERERLRNTLLAGVSHDFRTPLTTIVGSATSLLEQGHALADAERDALLRGVLTEARRLHALTSDMLDLARMEEGAIEPSLEWCPADELVEEARAAAAAALRGRAVQVRVDADLVLWCDPRLVGQALVNLLDNAGRHTAPGAVVEIAISAGAGAWHLVVRDDGPGIAAGLEREVFKKFFRSPSAGQGGGTGLGLAICAAVAQLHGGRISAAAGPGAHFELWLPQPAQPAPTLACG